MHEFPPIRTLPKSDRRFRADDQIPGAPKLPFGIGSPVHVRERVARVTSVRRHDGCAAVGLSGLDASGDLVLLSPFDRIRPVADVPRWTRRGWRATLEAVARAAVEAAGLPRAGGIAATARAVRLLDWQLEPALALLDGRASRLLVADAVGLGKTVQAAWALIATGDPSRDRTLVLAPAGLRDQWQAELARLFGIEAMVVDAAHLRRLRRTLPPSVNPWALAGVFITAIDFAKQPEVLAGLLDARWALVVLDEAHGLTDHTDRRRAADLLARGADDVMLLTATPHSGDPIEFEALCRIGESGGDPLLSFRRSRGDVGMRTDRKVRTIAIRPTPAERRLHRELRQYLRRLRRGTLLDPDTAGLIRWVLLKRAVSSPHALLRTLIRRRNGIAGGAAEPAQADLPFGDPGEHDGGDEWLPDAIDAPAFRDRPSEAGMLDRLVACAADAASGDSKRLALQRLLRRVGEPALVFTEYRDTLHHLADLLEDPRPAVLHGGMTRGERRDSVRAFTTGAARVLLATDAAGEGLNLHQTCRLVINMDVPWNPTRLEQRLGRVDRIGQPRPVHAITLAIGSGFERVFARRFMARQRRIRKDLDGSARQGAPHPEADAWRGGAGPPDGRVSLLSSALALIRSVSVRGPRRSHPAIETPRHAPPVERRHGPRRRSARRVVPWTEVRPSLRRRLDLPAGVLLLFRASAMTADGTVAAATAIPVMVRCDTAALRRGARRRMLRALERAARPAAARHAAAALEHALRAHQARVRRRARRVAASLDAVAVAPRPYQAGLFDRRAMTAALRQRLADDQRRRALQDALDRLALHARIEEALQLHPLAALVLR